MLKLGVYKHYKGGLYEVIAIAENENILGTWFVIYKSLKDGRIWQRGLNNFTENIGPTIPRFELQRAYGTQRQLFVQTLRENRLFWFKGLEQNPAMKVNGEGTYFKFTLGDKISFALSVRIIGKKEAEALIAWVNTWSTKDDRLLDFAAWERMLARGTQ